MILLALNWKMAPETKEKAISLARVTNTLARKVKKKVAVAVCAPSIHIPTIKKFLTSVALGAQTVAGAETVAQTGAVGAGLLRAYGTSYCIVGHSESRARGETDAVVGGEVQSLLEKKIVPIICVGERERDAQGWYLSAIKDQIESALTGVSKAALARVVFAYEPIWAIGSSAVREATPAECHAMMIFIRKVIADRYDNKSAGLVPILYGGSVDEINAKTFITEGTAQGLLVGRVSLDPKRLTKLVTTLSA